MSTLQHIMKLPEEPTCRQTSRQRPVFMLIVSITKFAYPLAFGNLGT